MDKEEKRLRRNAYAREWRAKHIERVRAANRDYCARNAERMRQKSAKWRADNLERARAAARERSRAVPRKGRPFGERNHNWKGDSVAYESLHQWVIRHRGQPSLCERCGTSSAKKFEWANVDHKYRRVLEDYFRACTSCHRNYDYANGLAKKGGRKPQPR